MSRADYLAWLEATEPARQQQRRLDAQARRWQQWYALHPPTPRLGTESRTGRCRATTAHTRGERQWMKAL